MLELSKQLEKYISRLAASDLRDDVLDEVGDNEINLTSDELMQKIAFLKQEIKTLEQTKNDIIKLGKKYFSPSDPDASLMKGRTGKMPAYNVQSVVDSEFHMIAEAKVTTSAVDKNELISTMTSLKKKCGINPQEVLADKGYYNLAAIKTLEDENGVKCFIPGEKQLDRGIFTYNRDEDTYMCSLGKVLKFKQHRVKRGQLYRQYQGQNCDACPIRSKCTKSKFGRIVCRHQDQDWQNEYKKRIETKDGKKKISNRKNIVEHVFGTIRYLMGQMPILLRGKFKVQAEIDIYATAYNFKRLVNIERFSDLMKKISEYKWTVEKNENQSPATPTSSTCCAFVNTMIAAFYSDVLWRKILWC